VNGRGHSKDEAARREEVIEPAAAAMLALYQSTICEISPSYLNSCSANPAKVSSR
jgi:hypothetical protein